MKEMTSEYTDLIMESGCWNCNNSTVAVSDRGSYCAYCFLNGEFMFDEDIIGDMDSIPNCFECATVKEKEALSFEYEIALEKYRDTIRKEVVNKLVEDYEQGCFHAQDFYKTLSVVIEIYGNEIQDRNFLTLKMNSTIILFSEEEVKEYLIKNGYVGKTTFETMIEWIPDKDKETFFEKEFNIFKSEKEKVYYQQI